MTTERDLLELLDVPTPALADWYRGSTDQFDLGFRLLDDDEADVRRRGHGNAIIAACRQAERAGIELRVLRPVSRRRVVLREVETLYGRFDIEPSRRALDRWIGEFLAGGCNRALRASHGSANVCTLSPRSTREDAPWRQPIRRPR